jgi:ribonuclease P protein component
MLPQAARLRKTKDFKEVFGKGGGTRFGRLFLKARAVNPVRDCKFSQIKPHTHQETCTSNGVKNKNTRFGIVVSKQVAAKATDRNRTKRLLREAVKSCLPDVKEGHDIVLVTLPGFTAANLKEAKTQVTDIIKKSSLFKS